MKLTRENLLKAYAAELEKLPFTGAEIDIAYGKIIFEVVVEDHNAKIVSGLYQTTKTYNLDKQTSTTKQPLRSTT